MRPEQSPDGDRTEDGRSLTQCTGGSREREALQSYRNLLWSFAMAGHSLSNTPMSCIASRAVAITGNAGRMCRAQNKTGPSNFNHDPCPYSQSRRERRGQPGCSVMTASDQTTFGELIAGYILGQYLGTPLATCHWSRLLIRSNPHYELLWITSE